MSSPTMKNFKIAFFSALLVLAVAYPVLGLKLSTIGIKLQVEGASPAALWTIGGCAIAMFFWQLFRDQVRAAWSHAPKLPSMPGKASEFLTLPSTQRWVVLALIVVALAWPFFGSRGAVDIATLILIYVMLGLGLNIVVGLAGLLDLGYVAFYAVGAYSYALLSFYFGLSFWICLPIAGLMAAFFGFILGFPVLRLRGDYLAIVTLGFGEIIRVFLNNLDHPVNITNGPKGLNQIDSISFFGLNLGKPVTVGGFEIVSVSLYYYLFLALVVLSVVICHRLELSRVGRAWMAIREDEIAAKAMGINTRNLKLLAFGMGATFGGVSGAMFGAFQGFISPESFSLMESIMIVAMVVLG
ncbi:MAG TPA: high-affinity branched-chain amino acid ABC transporter permease LivM, partial [Pseudomonas sp.]|nr:high-affinity branched-chain amino acid ABC transporter permease LivM [Pseudomonas sp.]